MDRANAPFDPVSLKIMWDRLVSLTDECLEAMVRASFSTTVRECYDLSVTVMDRNGRFIAQGSQSIPSFTGSTPVGRCIGWGCAIRKSGTRSRPSPRSKS